MSDVEASFDGSHVIFRQLMEIARISTLAELASGIAHELNQPLGAITTYAQAGERMLNRSEPLVDSGLDIFRQISEVALRAGEGIRRIRRLFGHDEMTLTRCKIAEVIDELRPLLSMLAHSGRGSLTVNVPAGLPDLLLDRRRVQHVLFALVQNAFEAMHPGEAAPVVTIDVSADRYAVEFGVTDSGPGIPPDARKHLFHPFFTTKVHGTGLGLASSRAIVEAHEGKIGYDNLPGSGCRFWFRVPIVATDPE